MSYELIWEAAGVRIRCFGTLTDDDLLRSNAEMYGDQSFGPSIRYQLMDALEVTEVAVRTETVRICARGDREISQHHPNIVVALVANQVALYGLSRLYQMQIEPSPWTTEVFQDLPAARAWIAGQSRNSAAS